MCLSCAVRNEFEDLAYRDLKQIVFAARQSAVPKYGLQLDACWKCRLCWCPICNPDALDQVGSAGNGWSVCFGSGDRISHDQPSEPSTARGHEFGYPSADSFR